MCPPPVFNGAYDGRSLRQKLLSNQDALNYSITTAQLSIFYSVRVTKRVILRRNKVFLFSINVYKYHKLSLCW